jgi:hypothetical protein
MGNSALSNLNPQEKKYFNILKQKIDEATNYKVLKTKESTSPTLNQVNTNNVNYMAINKISSDLKNKIKGKKRKYQEYDLD